MNYYGKYIREIREKNNDTLETLADKLNMTFSTLGKYERCERRITPELLEQVAKIYDVPVSYFFRETYKLSDEWLSFIEEMEERNLTPEKIKVTLEFLDKMGISKN